MGSSFLAIAFNTLHPSKPLQANNQLALKMRSRMAYATALHLIFFILSLSFVGFLPMIEDLLLACIAYSGYLTIKDWVIAGYLVFIVLFIIYGLFWEAA